MTAGYKRPAHTASRETHSAHDSIVTNTAAVPLHQSTLFLSYNVRASCRYHTLTQGCVELSLPLEKGAVAALTFLSDRSFL